MTLAGTGTARMDFAADSALLEGAVGEFADSYNFLRGNMKALAGNALKGDSLLLGLERGINQRLSTPVALPGSGTGYLHEAGVSFNDQGDLQVDAAKLAEELREVSRGIVYLVPTMLFTLDELGLEPLTGVHSLVISGSKMEPHHWDIARRLFPGATASEIYGASELSFVTVNSGEAEQPDPGFVGPPFSGVEIEIRSNGDGPGLVFVRSPYLFDGYFDESGSRSPIGPDGFMTVGDVGVLSEEGLSIVGRASNMLITGGKNVHPEEVESRLAEHESVSECVVVGLPDDRWGEEIVAFLVASNPGDLPDAGELRDHLKDLVASYKVPKRWFTVEQIPRTRAGKTDRSRDRLLELATEI